MADYNRSNIVLTDEQKTTVYSSIESIHSVLNAIFIPITKEEKREIPKMSDKTIPFVDKVNYYLEKNPEFAPSFMHADGFQIDFQSYKDLNGFYRILQQLVQNLDDTIMVTGSEAYRGALAYYNAVKQASKMNAPGAKTIYDDLKNRFPHKRTNEEE